MTEKELASNEGTTTTEYRAKKFIKKHKDEEPKRTYPIDVKNGYYARNEQEYRFDKMIREHAKKTGQDAMFNHISDQMARNHLRRIEDTLEFICEKLCSIEDKLNGVS